MAPAHLQNGSAPAYYPAGASLMLGPPAPARCWDGLRLGADEGVSGWIQDGRTDGRDEGRPLAARAARFSRENGSRNRIAAASASSRNRPQPHPARHVPAPTVTRKPPPDVTRERNKKKADPPHTPIVQPPPNSYEKKLLQRVPHAKSVHLDQRTVFGSKFRAVTTYVVAIWSANGVQVACV